MYRYERYGLAFSPWVFRAFLVDHEADDRDVSRFAFRGRLRADTVASQGRAVVGIVKLSLVVCTATACPAIKMHIAPVVPHDHAPAVLAMHVLVQAARCRPYRLLVHFVAFSAHAPLSNQYHSTSQGSRPSLPWKVASGNCWRTIASNRFRHSPYSLRISRTSSPVGSRADAAASGEPKYFSAAASSEVAARSTRS